MTTKEKAIDLVYKFSDYAFYDQSKDNAYQFTETRESSKQCALIAVENEYHSLREQLFNLRSCHVIESEKVYLARIDFLNQEESKIKTEIENL